MEGEDDEEQQSEHAIVAIFICISSQPDRQAGEIKQFSDIALALWEIRLHLPRARLGLVCQGAESHGSRCNSEKGDRNVGCDLECMARVVEIS
jgi:hypothetical protein